MTAQNEFSSHLVLKGSPKFSVASECFKSGWGGGIGGGQQVVRAGFAWALSADRVVANVDSCSLPFLQLHAEGKTCRNKWGKFQATVLDGTCKWILIKQRSENMLWHLSASVWENLIARTKTRHQAEERKKKKLWPGSKHFFFPFFPPSKVHLLFEIAYCSILYVCD